MKYLMKDGNPIEILSVEQIINDNTVITSPVNDELLDKLGIGKHVIESEMPTFDNTLYSIKERFEEDEINIYKKYDLIELNINDAKLQKISLSKQLLSDFLENNPLKSDCHGGVVKEYNATFEKQSIFTSKFTSHSVKVQVGVPDVMRWNAVGEECEEWTDAECVAFIIDMDNYVSAIVSHQQHLEIEINACETIEELNGIEVTYDEFKIT